VQKKKMVNNATKKTVQQVMNSLYFEIYRRVPEEDVDAVSCLLNLQSNNQMQRYESNIIRANIAHERTSTTPSPQPSISFASYVTSTPNPGPSNSNMSISSLKPTPLTSKKAAKKSIIQKEQAISLDMVIPSKEYEANIDVLLVNTFKQAMEKMNTSLETKKNSEFKRLLDEIKKKPLYSMATVQRKRKRENSTVFLTPPVSEDEGAAKKRIRLDSNVESEDEFPLEIVLDESSHTIYSQNPQTPKPEDEIENEEDDDEDEEDEETDNEEFDPELTRYYVDRLKCIEHKKPKIEIIDLEMEYNENMKRHFPGAKNRTAAQQERRDRNTQAARCSRRKNKLYEDALTSKIIDIVGENISKKREVAILRSYANALMSICIPQSKTDCTTIWKESRLKSIIYGNCKKSNMK
jgi:hypothetical protein